MNTPSATPTGASANAGPSQAQSDQITIDGVVTEILNASEPPALAKRLYKLWSDEKFENVLSSSLTSGEDPLVVLNMELNTLGYLFILSSRLNFPEANIPPLQMISDFCRILNVDQARLAPDRVNLLAKGIVRVTENSRCLPSAIPILHDLLIRYCPDLTYLTPLHATFVRTCVTTRRYTAALPVLSHRVADLFQPAPSSYGDLHYNDYLVYHYAGGMTFAALRQWKEAMEYFEAVVTCPAMAAAALQLEALKKLALINLIVYGKVQNPPKYAHATPIRQWRSSIYFQFAQAYPSRTEALKSILEKDNQFTTDKNLGLVKIALEYAPRWCIRKLTETYMTMSLSDIGREVGIASEEDVRTIVISMIEQGEIDATISADGTVTFEDSPPSFTKEEIEQMLRAAQTQSMLFSELDRQTGRSKDYLIKALARGREEGPWGPDEDIFRNDKESAWTEEAMF